MSYFDAEILVRDVNARNAVIYTDGWTYVSSPKTKERPQYFVPYFTRENAEPGIQYISRVLEVQDMKLSDAATVPDAPSDEHRKRWREGLRLLRERAEDEGWSGKEARVFYLDKPTTVTKTPLTKQCFNAGNPEKQIPSRIPEGFSLRFDQLFPGLLLNS